MAGKTKLIALNVGLAAGLALIVWQGRARWNEAEAERHNNINVPVRRISPPPMTPAPRPEVVQATKYTDVATKNLFSKDRNPTVVVDAPKVEAPKVMPSLPVVYGVLGLPSGTKAIMAERSGGPSKSVHVGDTVGDFKILALDSKKVTFEWDGKPLVRNLDDLADKTGAAAAGAPGVSVATSGPAAPPAPRPGSPASASMGADNGTPEAPSRACKAGDTSPIGTVVDGYRKSGVLSPFGITGCTWVQNK